MITLMLATNLMILMACKAMMPTSFNNSFLKKKLPN